MGSYSKNNGAILDLTRSTSPKGRQARPQMRAFDWLSVLETTNTEPVVLNEVAEAAEVFVVVHQVPEVGVVTIGLRSTPEVRVVAGAAEIAVVAVTCWKRRKTESVSACRYAGISLPPTATFQTRSHAFATIIGHVVIKRIPLVSTRQVPTIRTRSLCACPLVQASVFRAAVGTVIVAPGTVHCVIQILRHPRLRADCHSLISLSSINKGAVFNGRRT